MESIDEPADLRGGLTLGAEGDQEPGDLRCGGLAPHDLPHSPVRRRTIEVTASEEFVQEIRPRFRAGGFGEIAVRCGERH